MYCQFVICLNSLFVFKKSTNNVSIDLLTNNNLTIDARQLSMLPDKKGDLFDLHHPCNVFTSILIQTTTHSVVNALKPCPRREFYNTYPMLPSVAPRQEEKLNMSSRNIMYPSPKTNVEIGNGVILRCKRRCACL